MFPLAQLRSSVRKRNVAKEKIYIRTSATFASSAAAP